MTPNGPPLEVDVTRVSQTTVDRAVAKALPSPPFDPAAVYTIAQAAEAFSVTPRQMRRWVYDGKMGYVLLPGGRGRRVTGQHLNDAWAAGNTPASEGR